VGDEVVVGFVHGSFDHPIILGGMYNGVDAAASNRNGGKDEKLIRTKAGHEIRLIDTKDGEKIVVRDKSGQAVIEMATSGPAITIEAKGGTVKVHAKSITVQADDSLELKGKSVTISADDKVTVTGHEIHLN
jgi:uncharacterized protein involved in type VI secretion and phage assembly